MTTAAEPSVLGDQIARLWFEVTTQRWDDDLYEWFARLADRHDSFRTASLNVIAQVGRSHFLKHNSLKIEDWAAKVDHVAPLLARYQASTSANAESLDYAEWLDRRSAVDVLDRLDANDWLARDVTKAFPHRTVREAHELLRQRALNGPVAWDGRLRPLRHRPLRHDATAIDTPVVKVDQRELVILHLLALTAPGLQFFYDKRGEPVPGYLNGYHARSADRPDPVTGLSQALDAVADIVREHRFGQGGRIYISGGSVICPAHSHTIARIAAP